MPTILIFFWSVYNGWNPVGSLWQPVAFVREKNAYAWEVYFINYITAYSLLLFITVYYPLNTFQHMGKMFMNSLLFMVWEVHFFTEDDYKILNILKYGRNHSFHGNNTQCHVSQLVCALWSVN